MKISVEALRTRIFAKNEDLSHFIVESVPKDQVREGLVLAVTSKIVSLAENCLIPQNQMNKADLVRREADVFLGEIGYGCFLTIKDGLFIASAGIDESNSVDGEYILYPKDPFASAQKLWRDLRQSWGLKNLGVLLTDSHTSPLRQGVTGICLSCWGFQPVRNMIGRNDLFGRELKMTKMNLADGLSAMAVMTMGEGAEQSPLALIHGAQLEFCESLDRKDLCMPLEQDLYFPLIGQFMKTKNQ